jgi:hypothetical protein
LFFFFLFFQEKNNVLRNKTAHTRSSWGKMSSLGGTNVTSVWKDILAQQRRVSPIIAAVVCVLVAIAMYGWWLRRRHLITQEQKEACGPMVIAGMGSNYHTVRRRLLVLDMNGLLCHRKHVSELQGIPDEIVGLAQRRGNQFVWARPYADEFLRYCLDRFDVAIWSSATQARLMEFMPAVVAEDVYRRLAFVWSQHQCDQDPQDPTLWKKDLRRVYAYVKAWGTAQEEEVLLLDDVVEKVRDNEPYSVMLINPWCPYGEGKGMYDEELRVGVGWLWQEIQELAYYGGSVREFIRERVERNNSDESETAN